MTPKQEMFVKEYLIDLNATQAAVRAGYSKKSAMEIGYQLLRKTSVQEAIQKAVNERAKNVEVTTEWILQGIKDIADNLDEQTKDRLKAYELLGKYLKMFTDKHEMSGANNGPIQFMFVDPDDEQPYSSNN
jgi:phage terminase small subunit